MDNSLERTIANIKRLKCLAYEARLARLAEQGYIALVDNDNKPRLNQNWDNRVDRALSAMSAEIHTSVHLPENTGFLRSNVGGEVIIEVDDNGEDI